jgi:hypothetical protein
VLRRPWHSSPPSPPPPRRRDAGGAWYTENQFDSEFIEVLREACSQYIGRQGDTTLKEVRAGKGGLELV